MADQDIDRRELLEQTAKIVAAHLSNNAVSPRELPGFIDRVFGRLAALTGGAEAPAAERVPAVPIRRSVTNDSIVCLECGKKLKTLKRHLLSEHGLSPEEYRERWGLRPDYPVVAPAYSAVRKALAIERGLGRKPAPPSPEPAPKARRRQRKRPSAA